MGDVDDSSNMFSVHQQSAGAMKDTLSTDAAYSYTTTDHMGYASNAVVEDGGGESTTTEQTNGDDKKEMTELDKYWKAVNDNPQDFTGWTYLLQYVEQENDLSAARQAFDAFFKHYPYCYGYWKKYADLEKKNNNVDQCQEVFEQGVKAIPLSVDLWVHYITFFKSQYSDEGSEEQLRQVYERSIKAAGLEFRSDRLWEMYVAFEVEKKRPRNAMAVYDRLVTTPTQLYSHQFEKFEEFVRANHPKDILSTDEFLSLRKEIASRDKEEVTQDSEPEGARCSPPPGLENDGQSDDSTEVKYSKMAEDEIAALRERILEQRRPIHKLNEEEVSKRWNYEEGIKRPYFHVKPLERTQLSNWREYLDFEIASGNYERACILFERCLIACALYEDLWLKYAKYQEEANVEAARDVYTRACTIHLPKKPSIHLMWASFEERHGSFDKASAVLSSMEKNFPGYLPIAFRRINLVRRQGKHEEAEKLYKEYVAASKSPQVASLYALKQARYRQKVLGDEVGAVKILMDAIENDKDNARLYMQLIDIYYQTTPFNEESVIKAFDGALSSDMAIEAKVLFAQRKVEFLEDLGSNVTRLEEAYDELNKLAKAGSDKRKRILEEGGEDPLMKRARTDMNGMAAAATPTMAAAAAAAVTSATAGATADQTAAYNYNWASYPQNYQQYQTAWNMYGQHYYPQQ